jgi:hypothetical protein
VLPEFDEDEELEAEPDVEAEGVEEEDEAEDPPDPPSELLLDDEEDEPPADEELFDPRLSVR